MKKIPFLQILLLLVIFLFFVYPPSDYDFGWHLRYGEYFWQQGTILRENLYSYTLPFYRWVNHSWLYDPIFYVVFKTFGFLGIAIFGPLLILVALWVLFKAIQASSLEKLLMAFSLAYLGIHSLNEGVRSRYFSFILLAVLYWLLTKARENRNYLFILPPLFLIWVNFHGTFTIGLLYLFLVWLVGIYGALKEPKKYFQDWLIMAGMGLASGVAVLINPFGFGVIKEAIKHATSPHLRLVLEYAALDPKSERGIGMIVYLLLMTGLIIWRRNKDAVLEALPLIPFAILAFQGVRNTAVFMLLSLPLMIKLLRPYLERLVKLSVYSTIFPLILTTTLIGLIFRLPRFHLTSYSWQNYCRYSSGCSEAASDYLRQNPPKGRGLTLYDWGGYLIWQVPEIKPFIDGRMHLWQIEGHYLMVEYHKLTTLTEDWEKVFQDFDFAWVFFPPEIKLIERLELLAQSGIWEKVYQDDLSVIYVRRVPPPPEEVL